MRTGAARSLDAEVLSRVDRCELGRWLESPLACFEGIEELRRIHSEFHALAGGLVQSLQGNGSADERERMAVRLEELSARLVARLGHRNACSAG